MIHLDWTKGIFSYIVEIDEIETDVYAIEIETVGEIVDWKDGEQKVLNELVINPTYDLGELEIVTASDSLAEIYEYAKLNYPKVNLINLIEAHYVD